MKYFYSNFVVILPTSALEELCKNTLLVFLTVAHGEIDFPIIFEVKNPDIPLRTYCGALEFTAEEGKVVLPEWVHLIQFSSFTFVVNERFICRRRFSSFSSSCAASQR